MQTVLTSDPAVAASILRSGGLVAFPTETVYGLGADVFNADAVRRIFGAKMRPADNPLIAHVGDRSQIGSLARHLTPSAEVLIEAFFPGPLTVVVPKADGVPDEATAGLDTIGIRMPRHPVAAAFLKECGVPVVAPSANLSGRPSPTDWRSVNEDLGGRIDCILEGEATEIGLESTVVDCTGEIPLVLRAGAVSVEELRGLLPEIRVYRPRHGEAPRSPGLKHRHYSPRARVLVVESGSENPGADAAFIGIRRPRPGFQLERICGSKEEYARSVFAFFRECDRLGVSRIECEEVEDSGIGAALMDRLRRAEER